MPTPMTANPEPATVVRMPRKSHSTCHTRARLSSAVMKHTPSVNDMNDGSSMIQPLDL